MISVRLSFVAVVTSVRVLDLYGAGGRAPPLPSASPPAPRGERGWDGSREAGWAPVTPGDWG